MKPQLFSIFLLTILMASCQKESVIWLNETDITGMTTGTGYGNALSNKSIINKPLSIAGHFFEQGIGTHAFSTFVLDLNGSSKSISGKAGVDDGAKKTASVRFYLIGDRKILWDSEIMHSGDTAKAFKVKLKGIKKLGMLVTDAEDGISQDYADWVDVSINYREKAPAVPNYLKEEPYMLTPPSPAEPRINGPKIYGVRPGSPFLYRIPCTGERPVTFSVTSLPEGLSLDAVSGIIKGSINTKGTFLTTLHAKNGKGESAREFKIVVGDKLMLTPSMGWNSWYIHKQYVTDSIMRNAADQMIASGMADYGYQYVNIDDCWNVKANSEDPVLGGPVRDRSGKLLCNKNFPDMTAMTEYIHSKGLKAGTYISPGATTCAGYAGSYMHEAQDARTFADWGFDFLKYDWCSYRKIAPDQSLESLKAPYILMWNELKKQNRDIVLNLCQYGLGNVWTWGGEMGHSWRTTGDLGLMRGKSMPGFYYIGRSNADHWEYAKPGNWNDPDYILIGYVMDAFDKDKVVRAYLSPSEQYFYMSMWSLMASPLVFSGDMGRLDNFILNVLCNNEVIDINLDPLGRQGRIIREGNSEMVMVKELEDGSIAVGLFHATEGITDPSGYLNWGEPVKISVSADELGLSGKFKVRDVWRQKDLGEFTGKFEAEVPFHGVSMIRIMK